MFGRIWRFHAFGGFPGKTVTVHEPFGEAQLIGNLALLHRVANVFERCVAVELIVREAFAVKSRQVRRSCGEVSGSVSDGVMKRRHLCCCRLVSRLEFR